MHDHRHDDLADPLRPPASRVDGDRERTDAYGRAAAAGRLEVLGATGALDLQRMAGNDAVAQLLEDGQSGSDERSSPVHGVISSSGRPLETDVRTDMESRLGADFGDVRVHDDSAAAASARAVNAHAYTVGSNIVFQRDTYDPVSDAGRLTLAHELTHVMQQRSGPVDGTAAPGGIKVSDPGDRFEREASANAERAMASEAPAAVQRHADADHGDQDDTVQGLFVQRVADTGIEEDDEEPVQGLFVQREGEDELEDEGATS